MTAFDEEPLHRLRSRMRILIVASLLLSSPRGAHAQPVTQADRDQFRTPGDSFTFYDTADVNRRNRATKRVAVVGSHLGRMLLDIPEYHDEQRFAVGASYGPVAYAYASPYLGGFSHVNQINAHETGGMFAAVVFVEAAPATPLAPAYTALRLKPGLNCVYLGHSGPSETMNWWGMVVAGSEITGCPRPPSGTPRLPVHVTQTAGATPADYPAVARFGRSTLEHATLGMRCLAAWCEITGGGETPEPSITNGVPGLPGGFRASVRGWYDEQVLASLDAAGKLTPSKIRAAVVPEPGVETRSKAEYQDFWRRAAVIVLDRDPTGTKYATKWGMRQGANAVDLAFAEGKWRARVTPIPVMGGPRPKSTIVFVTQERHLDLVVPGTARFRWRMNDDGVWISCDQGCCRIDADRA